MIRLRRRSMLCPALGPASSSTGRSARSRPARQLSFTTATRLSVAVGSRDRNAKEDMAKAKKRPSKTAKAAQKLVEKSKLLADKAERDLQSGQEFKSSVVTP